MAFWNVNNTLQQPAAVIVRVKIVCLKQHAFLQAVRAVLETLDAIKSQKSVTSLHDINTATEWVHSAVRAESLYIKSDWSQSCRFKIICEAKNQVFCDMTPYRFLGVYRYFGQIAASNFRIHAVCDLSVVSTSGLRLECLSLHITTFIPLAPNHEPWEMLKIPPYICYSSLNVAVFFKHWPCVFMNGLAQFWEWQTFLFPPPALPTHVSHPLKRKVLFCCLFRVSQPFCSRHHSTSYHTWRREECGDFRRSAWLMTNCSWICFCDGV